MCKDKKKLKYNKYHTYTYNLQQNNRLGFYINVFN